MVDFANITSKVLAWEVQMAPPMATPLNFAVIAAAALRRIVPGFSLKLLSKISAQKVGQTNMIFLHNCAKLCEKQKVSKNENKKVARKFW